MRKTIVAITLALTLAFSSIAFAVPYDPGFDSGPRLDPPYGLDF